MEATNDGTKGGATWGVARDGTGTLFPKVEKENRRRCARARLLKYQYSISPLTQRNGWAALLSVANIC